MAEIIGVRFKRGGKIYYFQPNDEELEVGAFAIVETIRGTECGEIVLGRREIPDEELNHELKTIIRKATADDIQRVEENKRKAERAFEICNEKIKAHGLDMNLLEVEYTFDNSKILFSFSAEGRVDFRDLVKDLASVFRARIELRQIGVRDEAKMLGGLGVCGRPFCCKQFMGEFQSVSIKMAKEQGLSLNPIKISGTCGRLMCCLKHEQDAYEDLIRTSPRIGSTVITPDGKGVVTDQELIAGRVKVRLDTAIESPPKSYKIFELKKCNDSRNEVVADDYIERMPSRFDMPESSEELEMLNELEQMESGEGTSNSRRPNGGRNNAHRRGKPHQGGNFKNNANSGYSERGNHEYSDGNNFSRRNNSDKDNASGDKPSHGKPHGKCKGKPHSAKNSGGFSHRNGNPAHKNKGE